MIANTFHKQYTDFFKEGLNPTEAAILTLIYNRNQLSVNNPQFFDKELNDYYVIYPVLDIKDELNISESTVKRTLKSLVKKDWLILKRAKKSRVNMIFIPDARKVEKNTDKEDSLIEDTNIQSKNNNCVPQLTATSNKVKKCDIPNNITNLHSESVKLTSSNSSICSPIKSDNIKNNNTYRLINDSYNIQIEQEKSSEKALASTMKKQGLPEEAINLIQIWSNHKPQKQKEIKDLIFKTKSIAQQNANKSGKDIVLSFESDLFDMQEFINRLNVILVKAFKTAKKPMNYIFWSLLNFFESEVNKELKQLNKEFKSIQTSENLSIPLVKWTKDSELVTY